MIGSVSIRGPHFSGLCRQKKDMIITTTVMTIRKHVSIHFAIFAGGRRENEYEVEIWEMSYNLMWDFMKKMRGIYRMKRRIETLGNEVIPYKRKIWVEVRFERKCMIMLGKREMYRIKLGFGFWKRDLKRDFENNGI